MNKNSKIYVAGHKGMVGSAIVRKLQSEGYAHLVLASSSDLDLRNQQAVEKFFASEKPEYVFLAAAKVGGVSTLRVSDHRRSQHRRSQLEGFTPARQISQIGRAHV